MTPPDQQTLTQRTTDRENLKGVSRAAAWFVRIALSTAFLSAVADRFGFWGAPGSEGVAWGSIEQYEEYVALLNGFLPTVLISPVGWTATVLEIVIAFGLLIGWRLRWFALAAFVLLMLFATAMLVSLGPKPPLDYSVFSAASAAFLLYALLSERTCRG